MKQLKMGSQKNFDREKHALSRIQKLKHKHLIEMIASFHMDSTYCFLFPWAESGHLEDFWEKMNHEPRSADLILWVFEQMKGLASAVMELNSPTIRYKEQENGRHGDLKPENILLFDVGSTATPRGVLQITDAGLARFHNLYTSVRVQGTTTYGSTIQYAPPEALNRDQNAKRSRLFDMWSLGCVCLEFLTWLLLGYDEIVAFRSRREQFGGCEDSEFYTKGNGQFVVHPEVELHMNVLLENERCQIDTCFKDLLGIVKDHMLVVDVDRRLDSSQLDRRLGIIFDKAKHDSAYLCGPQHDN